MSERRFRVVRRLAIGVVAVGWLYILAFSFHHWTERLLGGGLIADGLTSGLLFERWRQRGDRLARVPFLVAVAAFAAAIMVASVSTRTFAWAGGIGILGAVSAWSTRLVVRGDRVSGDPVTGSAAPRDRREP